MNGWPPRRASQSTVFIAADASNDRWSWTELRDGRVVRNPSGQFTDAADNALGVFPDSSTPIYYKELFAVLLALRELEGSAIGMVVLIGDNTGVIGSIRKRLAPEGAWGMIDEIEEIVRRNGWGLDLRWVESDGNVAHSATHCEPVTKYRTFRTWQLCGAEGYFEPVGGRGKRDIDGVLI